MIQSHLCQGPQGSSRLVGMRPLPLSSGWTCLFTQLGPNQVPDLVLVLVDPTREHGGDEPVHGHRVPGHEVLDQVRGGLLPLEHDHDVGQRLRVLGVGQLRDQRQDAVHRKVVTCGATIYHNAVLSCTISKNLQIYNAQNKLIQHKSTTDLTEAAIKRIVQTSPM